MNALAWQTTDGLTNGWTDEPTETKDWSPDNLEFNSECPSTTFTLTGHRGDGAKGGGGGGGGGIGGGER